MRRLSLHRQQWAALVVLIAILAAVWVYRQPLMTSLRHGDAARAWFHELGVMGPVVLVAINALQIVVAPIPGYVVQIAAGWVYGIWPGAFYAIIGLAVGAFLAMSLARLLGRPFALRVLGAERLAHWEHVVHADRLWLWALLFLGPVGDVPYILAGLSRFPIPRLLLLALLIRSPGVVAAAAIGAGLGELDLALVYRRILAWMLTLSPWWWIGPVVVVPILAWWGYRLGRRGIARVNERLYRQVVRQVRDHSP
jgi:uncharacterized membrane protein YdjX (TVP38/TMEM64 family)